MLVVIDPRRASFDVDLPISAGTRCIDSRLRCLGRSLCQYRKLRGSVETHCQGSDGEEECCGYERNASVEQKKKEQDSGCRPDSDSPSCRVVRLVLREVWYCLLNIDRDC